jgi:hypothetical protein
MKLPVLLLVAAGLVHCGPTLPVKATVVSCTTKQPIEGAQFDRMGNITRSNPDGTWESSTIGEGTFPVDVMKAGYKKEKFQLKPGQQGQVVCMTPES